MKYVWHGEKVSKETFYSRQTEARKQRKEKGYYSITDIKRRIPKGSEGKVTSKGEYEASKHSREISRIKNVLEKGKDYYEKHPEAKKTWLRELAYEKRKLAEANLTKLIEKAKKKGYRPTEESISKLQKFVREHPESELTLKEVEEGLRIQAKTRVTRKVPRVSGLEKIPEVPPTVLRKLAELGKKKPEFKPYRETTISPEQEEAIRRSRERAKAQAYTPIKETMEVYPPEAIVTEEKEIEEEGSKKIVQTLDTSFKFRSKFDVEQAKIEKSWEKEPTETQVAREVAIQLARASPLVSGVKMIAPTDLVKPEERVLAGVQTALWVSPMVLPSKWLTGLALVGGGYGVARGLPKAIKGEPRAIASTLISGVALTSGLYGIYKDFNTIQTKTILRSERESRLFLKDREILEASRVRLKGEILARSKLDKIFGKGWREIDTIEGGGRILASELEGKITGYGTYDYWLTSERLAGRSFDKFLAQLSKEQLRALAEGKKIRFKSWDVGISDIIEKGDVTRSTTLKMFDNELAQLWKIRTKGIEVTRTIGLTTKPLDISLIRPIDIETSLFVKERAKLGLNYDQLTSIGIGKARSIAEKSLEGYYSGSISDVARFVSPPPEIKRFDKLDLGIKETKPALDLATEQLEKSMTKTIEKGISEAVTEVRPEIKHPIIISPAEEIKEEEITIKTEKKDLDLFEKEVEKTQSMLDYSSIIAERDLIKEQEEKMIEEVKLGRHLLPSVSSRSMEKQLKKELQKTEQITEQLQKEITIQEPITEQITEELTKLEELPTYTIPPELIITEITIPPPPELPPLEFRTREFALKVPETIDIGRLPSMRELAYTPSIMALELNIEKEMKDIEKDFTTGLELRPIPRRRRRKKKKR